MTYAGRKYILVEKQISISTYKYQFHQGKEVRNLWILEAAIDRRSVKISIPKSMIKLLEKYLWKSLVSKDTGNSSKILVKMNYFTNIFQGFQTTDLTLPYKTSILKNTFFDRFCSVNINLFKFNRINKYNVQS